MNYQAHYDRLMIRAKGRVLEGYSERHHILPKCLGGDDSKTNKVRLMPEEHYVAHQLLVKIYPGNFKILWSVAAMTNSTGKMARNNKLYGWLRRRLAERLKLRKHTEETKKKMSEVQKIAWQKPGRVGLQSHSVESRLKISTARMGMVFSEKHRAKLAAAKLGKKRGPHSDEHKKNLSNGIRQAKAIKGREAYFDDPSYKENQRQKTLLVWARRRTGELPARKIRTSFSPVGG